MGLFGQKNEPRRGRQRPPLTNTSENPRYSYYQKRSTIESDNVRRRREESGEYNTPRKYMWLRRLARNWVSVLAILVIVAVLCYMTTLSTSPSVRIVDDDSPGAALLADQQTYKQAAARVMSKSPLNRSKFLVDSNQLARQLEEDHPELAGVTVVVPIIGTRPTFVIRPIHPSFILSSGEDSYIVNEFGVAVANISQIENVSMLNLVSVIDKSNLLIEQGKPALSAEQTEFINTVIAQLKEKNIDIANFTIPVSAYDLELRLQGRPYYVRFNMLENPKQQVGSFLAVQNEIEKSHQKVNDYIDVRVEERVYIR